MCLKENGTTCVQLFFVDIGSTYAIPKREVRVTELRLADEPDLAFEFVFSRIRLRKITIEFNCLLRVFFFNKDNKDTSEVKI